MVVVTPVTICRIGSLAGWTPPFWLYMLSGICFASSGESAAAFYMHMLLIHQCLGATDTILFLFTRHTFIRNALGPQTKATLVHITKQQITIRDDEHVISDKRKEEFHIGLDTLTIDRTPVSENKDLSSMD
jgi:hypothetical protein